MSKASGVGRLGLVIWPSNTLSRYFDVMGEPGSAADLPPAVSDLSIQQAVEALAPHGVTILGPGPSLVEDGLA